MGCDIHLVAEVRRDGVWTPAQELRREGKYSVSAVGKEFYGGRSYRLFSILANVRNGYGFAGVPTGEGFRPIAEPRGIPEDCHPDTRAYLEHYDSDGHSHSYHTVQQLLDYDWTQVTKLTGVLSAKEFWEWDRYARGQGEGPDSWCGDVAGAGVQIIDEEDMRQRIKGIISGHSAHASQVSALETDLHGVYTRCFWEQAYYQCASNFLSETMPRLWHLGRPEDVRILFFFDN